MQKLCSFPDAVLSTVHGRLYDESHKMLLAGNTFGAILFVAGEEFE
jgi:hypothetical protein